MGHKTEIKIQSQHLGDVILKIRYFQASGKSWRSRHPRSRSWRYPLDALLDGAMTSGPPSTPRLPSYSVQPVSSADIALRPLRDGPVFGFNPCTGGLSPREQTPPPARQRMGLLTWVQSALNSAETVFLGPELSRALLRITTSTRMASGPKSICLKIPAPESSYNTHVSAPGSLPLGQFILTIHPAW